MRYTTLNHALFVAFLAAVLVVLVGGLIETANAQTGNTISGHARVIDGDTIEINSTRIRLEGIDAPEQGQQCKRAWVPFPWSCGQVATRALRKLTKGRTVDCRSRGRDKYDRMIGVCFVEGTDINAVMVLRGHAWAFTKYSTSYVVEEKIARKNSRGIWRAATETAWAYRAKKWKVTEQVVPEGCPIKGNISSRGRVYHMPWSAWYARVRINTAKGERWFCSEADAIAAGWRPVAAG